MPKENIFSGKYEPDRDTCTEANESNVARFRTAMLKLDRIHNEASEQKILTHKIAGGMKLYELESNARLKVHRGEIWVVEVSTGVGRETTGIRWSLIISNTTHAKVSDAVNVVYLDGEEPKNLMSQMKINNTDLEFGTLTKQPSRINLTDLYTVDKKRFRDRKGKVTSAFMQKVMTRIAS